MAEAQMVEAQKVEVRKVEVERLANPVAGAAESFRRCTGGGKVTAYSLAITHQLTAQLTRMASLPPQLLIGHAAQIDFWADEVAHCLHVIDTYEQRFHSMLNAQQQFEFELDPLFYRPVPRPGFIAEPHRYHVRSELCRAFAAFVIALRRNVHTPTDVLKDQCTRLGITVLELDT